jgi:hypothetical protein
LSTYNISIHNNVLGPTTEKKGRITTTLEKKEETTNDNQGETSQAPKIKEGWNSMFLIGCSDNKDHI